MVSAHVHQALEGRGIGVIEATEPEQNATLQETQEEGGVVEVTNLEQINTSIHQGPVPSLIAWVLVEFS